MCNHHLDRRYVLPVLSLLVLDTDDLGHRRQAASLKTRLLPNPPGTRLLVPGMIAHAANCDARPSRTSSFPPARLRPPPAAGDVKPIRATPVDGARGRTGQSRRSFLLQCDSGLGLPALPRPGGPMTESTTIDGNQLLFLNPTTANWNVASRGAYLLPRTVPRTHGACVVQQLSIPAILISLNRVRGL
jgi:hypothetical protein